MLYDSSGRPRAIPNPPPRPQLCRLICSISCRHVLSLLYLLDTSRSYILAWHLCVYRDIIDSLGTPLQQTQEPCELVNHHHPGPMESSVHQLITGGIFGS